MRTFLATALACFCALAPTSTLTSRASDPPEWDAEYVSMDIPQTLSANQVFAVEITMKNTGTRTWEFVSGGSNPTALTSLAPAGNVTWGTRYIIQGQGTSVASGQEFTYKSFLRAPAQPGKYWFQWGVNGDPGQFGQPTAKIQITVGQPVAVNNPLAAMPKPDSTGKEPLTFGDFTYMGSFRLPHQVGNGGAGFSESGLTLRKYANGTERLMVNYTHPQGSLFEVDIPDLTKLKKFDGADASNLQTVEAKKVWGALAQNDVGANGGMYWDEQKKTLYWTYYHGYWTGGDLPVLQATKLNDDGTVTPVGSWTVPQQKWHWGGVTRLPKSFADRYTGGKTMALGFGGYFSICAPCSRGPAISAIAEPDPAAGSVNGLVNMLGHTDSTPALRPGNFFNANCGYWNKQPKGRGIAGTWTYADHSRSGVMIDVPDKQGYIAFVKLGTGRLGYDYGSITNAGEAHYWYFYDTRHLGQAARGDRELADVRPYQLHAQKAMGGLVTGSCFDPVRRKLYIIQMQSYWEGVELYPLIHVYHLKKV